MITTNNLFEAVALNSQDLGQLLAGTNLTEAFSTSYEFNLLHVAIWHGNADTIAAVLKAFLKLNPQERAASLSQLHIGGHTPLSELLVAYSEIPFIHACAILEQKEPGSIQKFKEVLKQNKDAIDVNFIQALDDTVLSVDSQTSEFSNPLPGWWQSAKRVGHNILNKAQYKNIATRDLNRANIPSEFATFATYGLLRDTRGHADSNYLTESINALKIKISAKVEEILAEIANKSLDSTTSMQQLNSLKQSINEYWYQIFEAPDEVLGRVESWIIRLTEEGIIYAQNLSDLTTKLADAKTTYPDILNKDNVKDGIKTQISIELAAFKTAKSTQTPLERLKEAQKKFSEIYKAISPYLNDEAYFNNAKADFFSGFISSFLKDLDGKKSIVEVMTTLDAVTSELKVMKGFTASKKINDSVAHLIKDIESRAKTLASPNAVSSDRTKIDKLFKHKDFFDSAVSSKISGLHSSHHACLDNYDSDLQSEATELYKTIWEYDYKINPTQSPWNVDNINQVVDKVSTTYSITRCNILPKGKAKIEHAKELVKTYDACYGAFDCAWKIASPSGLGILSNMWHYPASYLWGGSHPDADRTIHSFVSRSADALFTLFAAKLPMPTGLLKIPAYPLIKASKVATWSPSIPMPTSRLAKFLFWLPIKAINVVANWKGRLILYTSGEVAVKFMVHDKDISADHKFVGDLAGIAAGPLFTKGFSLYAAGHYLFASPTQPETKKETQQDAVRGLLTNMEEYIKLGYVQAKGQTVTPNAGEEMFCALKTNKTTPDACSKLGNHFAVFTSTKVNVGYVHVVGAGLSINKKDYMHTAKDGAKVLSYNPEQVNALVDVSTQAIISQNKDGVQKISFVASAHSAQVPGTEIAYVTLNRMRTSCIEGENKQSNDKLCVAMRKTEFSGDMVEGIGSKKVVESAVGPVTEQDAKGLKEYSVSQKDSDWTSTVVFHSLNGPGIANDQYIIKPGDEPKGFTHMIDGLMEILGDNSTTIYKVVPVA